MPTTLLLAPPRIFIPSYGPVVHRRLVACLMATYVTDDFTWTKKKSTIQRCSNRLFQQNSSAFHKVVCK